MGPAAMVMAFDTFLNNRRRVGYLRQEYPIVRALAVLCLLNLHAMHPRPLYKDRARAHLLWLADHRSPGHAGAGWGLGFRYTCMPAVDVREEASRFVLEAEIPGVSEKDVEVKVEENLLTLSSVKTVNEEREAEGAGGFIIRERKRGGFSRSFVLPKEADKERISASYANGVLTLEIPKLPKEEPRSIQIKSV
jgi:HSP20 family protein